MTRYISVVETCLACKSMWVSFLAPQKTKNQQNKKESINKNQIWQCSMSYYEYQQVLFQSLCTRYKESVISDNNKIPRRKYRKIQIDVNIIENQLVIYIEV